MDLRVLSGPQLSAAAKAYLEALSRVSYHGPRVDIQWENLSHSVQVPLKNTGITNVLESATRFASGGPFNQVPKKELNVLKGMNGEVKAGTCTLVLGNSGGGKTTFLRALSGRLEGYTGRVLWNGVAPSSLAAPHKLATLAPQEDTHEALLTVTESLEFAASCTLADLPSGASSAELSLRKDLVSHVIDTLGLRECALVALGDGQTRGVSGGQAKRVTLGEALVTGSRLLLLDEITNGLDSAIAEEVCAFLSAWAHVTGGTVVCALQAPTPEILASFDKVLLLSDGRQLYHGPPSQLAGYLESQGFPCPTTYDIADFSLLVCLSPAYAAQVLGLPVKATQASLADAWTASHPPSPPPTSSPTGVLLREGSADIGQFGVPQVHGFFRVLGLLLSRQFKLVKRNPAVSFGRVIQFLILGALFGSIYYKLKVDDFVTKISMAIFAASAVSFAAFAEIPAIFLGKRVACRHLEGGFYGPGAYVTSVMLNSLPVSIISTFLFATIMYFMCGFAEDAGRYFFFVLSLVAHELSTAALFRFLAFVAPTEELANAAAGITTGSLLIFGGFYM